jgi:hypothetical protein
VFLIRRSSFNVHLGLLVQISIYVAGLDFLSVDPGDLCIRYPVLITSQPDDWLSLPQSGVIERTGVPASSHPILLAQISVILLVMLDSRSKSELSAGSGTTDETGVGVDDRLPSETTSQVEVESDGANTSDDLLNGRFVLEWNFLGLYSNGTHHDNSSSKTGLSTSLSIRSSSKEEQSSQEDFLDVQSGEDGPQHLGVVKSTGLELGSLVGTPSQNILVGDVEKAHDEHSDDGNDGLDDRVDNDDQNDQTHGWPENSELEGCLTKAIVHQHCTVRHRPQDD